jgi:hypothetical protein
MYLETDMKLTLESFSVTRVIGLFWNERTWTLVLGAFPTQCGRKRKTRIEKRSLILVLPQEHHPFSTPILRYLDS